MFWRALSLRSKLLFLTLAGLITLAVFAFMQMNQSFQARQATIKSEFKTRAGMAAQTISTLFFERYTDVQAFALNSVFQSGQKESITSFLNSVVSIYQAYDAIVFVDKDGRFVASNNRTFDGRALDSKVMEGRSFADTPWFARAFKGEWSEDKRRGYTGTFVEDLQIDPVSSALFTTPQQGMSFSRSVVDGEGRVIGVLSARASLRFVENELLSIFMGMQAASMRSAQIVLLNKEGLVGAEAALESVGEKGALKRNTDRILRWNMATQQGQTAAQDVVSGKSGAIVENDRIARIERLWGYSPLKDYRFPEMLNWSVVISATTEDVMSDVLGQRKFFYPLLGLFVLLFGLTGYGVARSLAREYLELSAKLKDETLRLVEAGDELGGTLAKVSGQEKEHAGLVNRMIQQGKEVSEHAQDHSTALLDCAAEVRNALTEIQAQQRSAEDCLSELRQASLNIQEMSRLNSLVSEMKSRVAALNDVVFKVQLVGFNATIEANRAGQSGRGFAGVAQEIQSFSESTEQIASELSEFVTRIQAQTDELIGAVNTRVDGAEKIISEATRHSGKAEKSLPVVAEVMETSAQSLRNQDETLRFVAEAVEAVDSTMRRSSVMTSDLNRRMNEVRDQIYSIEDIVQDFGHAVRGLRVRSRLKKNASQSVFERSGDVSPERARADAVDRLAQKMRPRLVVKSDDHEPEVSETVDVGDSSRRAS